MLNRFKLLALAFLLSALTACGQKGPLTPAPQEPSTAVEQDAQDADSDAGEAND